MNFIDKLIEKTKTYKKLKKILKTKEDYYKFERLSKNINFKNELKEFVNFCIEIYTEIFIGLTFIKEVVLSLILLFSSPIILTFVFLWNLQRFLKNWFFKFVYYRYFKNKY